MQALLISTVAPLGTATGWQDLQERDQTEDSNATEVFLSGTQNSSYRMYQTEIPLSACSCLLLIKDVPKFQEFRNVIFVISIYLTTNDCRIT